MYGSNSCPPPFLLQRCIASTESSGIDIIVQILQTEFTALEDHQTLALELKVYCHTWTYV